MEGIGCNFKVPAGGYKAALQFMQNDGVSRQCRAVQCLTSRVDDGDAMSEPSVIALPSATLLTFTSTMGAPVRSRNSLMRAVLF